MDERLVLVLLPERTGAAPRRIDSFEVVGEIARRDATASPPPVTLA